MTQDLVDGATRWIGAEDVVLVGVALILVAMAWWSEKVRVDRFRSERRRPEQLTLAPPRQQVAAAQVAIKRWRRGLQDSQA